jgi:multidrug efflux pump subunit AcrA (membrane-fusion protein)
LQIHYLWIFVAAPHMKPFILFAAALLSVGLAAYAGAEPRVAPKSAAPQKPATGLKGVGPAAAGESKPAAPDVDTVDPAELTGRGPVLTECPIKFIQKVDVPGIEAGVLEVLEPKEGDEVRAGMTLGHIDDSQPRMEKTINEIEHAAAKAHYKSDTEIRLNQKAAKVAEYEYLRQRQAVDKVPGAIPEVELKKTEFAWKKAEIAIEKAEEDRRQVGFDADTKEAEVQAAELSILRRQIKAPFDGVVTDVYLHPGEWVAPGDRVLRVVGLDRLRIEGSVDASQYDPEEIDGRPVTVETSLAHGRKVQFIGKVIFVSPIVKAGSYAVFADVKNRQENGRYILREGLDATMTIHVK